MAKTNILGNALEGTNDTGSFVGTSSAAYQGQQYYNALMVEQPSVTVSSDGATITLSLEKDGGGDLNVFTSTGIKTLTAAPATVALTAGTDSAPVLNYVYILASTLPGSTITVSTSGFPAVEYAAVATVLCQSAATAQTDGVYKMHAWTDHLTGSDDNGHSSHINYWIRNQNASWTSGVALTPTVGVATFDIATTAGVVLQLHQHTMPAFDTSTGSHVYSPNWNASNYQKFTDLTTMLTDSTGSTLSGRYYNLVVWGSVSEDSGDCQLFVNVPTGSYSNSATAIADGDKTSVFNIPNDFKGTGFLISRLTMRNQGGSGGTFTLEQNEDLRGLLPSTATGSGIDSGTVTAGNENELAWYAATGDAVSGLTTAQGAVLITDASNVPGWLANPTATGRWLSSVSGAASVWSTATLPVTATGTGTILRADGTDWVATTSTFADTYGASQLLYSNGANTVVGLATANDGILITSATGVPSISSTLPDGLNLGTPTSLTLTNATGLPVTGLANGTDGEIITWDSSGVATTISTGTTGQVLTSNGAGSKPTWENSTSTPGEGGLRGWVSFVGTGTVTINDSENVTSVSDDGTGNYTINWTTNFVGATYSIGGIAMSPDSNLMNLCLENGSVAVGSVSVKCETQTATDTDSPYVSINAVGKERDAITATGGSITTSGGYTIHTFTSGGTFEITGGYDNVEYLVVAGGGGGGRDNQPARAAGGGGAGAMLTGTIPRGVGSYTVTVGAGGAGGTSAAGSACVGSNGGDSVFDTVTATGGGGGGGHSTVAQFVGANGGSGGGGCSGAAGGTGTTGGNNGGSGAGTTAGGGGGGAGAVGANGSGTTGGAGGAGTASSISGGSVTYAGGGGGHASVTGGAGGAGGGGAGAGGTGAGGAGTANTGGGGGGSRGSDGGAGGSGIVIVRYLTT